MEKFPPAPVPEKSPGMGDTRMKRGRGVKYTLLRMTKVVFQYDKLKNKGTWICVFIFMFCFFKWFY